MVLRIKFNFSLILFLCVLQSNGQNLVNIKHYSTVDGLSDNKITTVIKDRDGFMWFGSWAGISRFDGHNFVNFKSYPGDNSSLKSNRVDVIVEDKETGFLWVKAYDNQVYRFDKRTGLFTSLPNLLNDESLKEVAFTRIFSVSNHQVWLLSSDNGLFLIQDASSNHPNYKKFDIKEAPNHRIPSRKISFFYTDKSQNIWLATSKGVCILKKVGNRNYKVSSVKNVIGQTIGQMDDGKDMIWYTSGSKLFSVTYNQNSSNCYQLTEGIITSIKSSKNGDRVFCTTDKGELIVVTERGEVKLLAKTNDQSPLYSIFEDTDENLWIESEGYGAVLFDQKSKQLLTLFPKDKYPFRTGNSINYSIYEDVNKVVWIAFSHFGLGFYDKKDQKIQKISSADELSGKKLSDVIFHTYYFSPGLTWITGDKGGFDKVVFKPYDFLQTVVKPKSNIMIDNEVRGIFSDQQNRLWVGTKGEDVMVFKNGKRLPNLFNTPIAFKSGVYSIFKDKNGAMWFGTKSNGLFKALPTDVNQQQYRLSNQYFEDKIIKNGDNAIYSIIQDSKGRLWVGSYGGGLILFQNKGTETNILTLENSFKNYPKGNYKRIRNLKEDAQGKIWIATTDGLLIFDPNSASPNHVKFKVYRKQPGNIHSLGGNDVQFIYKDTQDQMWVLTSSGGLNLAMGKNPLDTLCFQNFSTKTGLPSDFLLSCTEDNHKNLWIATQNGISKFSIASKKFQNFNYYDGLPAEATFSESSGVRMPDGNIIFGNTQGFLTFNPSKIHAIKTSANMVFTKVEVNGKDVREIDSAFFKKDISYLNKLDLAYNQNIITIEFAVLDFNSSDKQNYDYRILGFDNVWRSNDGQSKITYTNLPPGKYTFQVKSANDELFSPIPFRSLKIIINPPFWKTWWAYTLYVIFTIVVLILIQRTIYTMLKLRHGIALEKKMVDLKLDFFTQISHELRTPLTLIVNPIAEVLQNENLSGKGKKYVKLVLKNAERMSRLVNQILDLRKVQSGKATLKLQDIEIVSFLKNLISYFEETIDKRNLNVQFVATNDVIHAHWDTEKIEIVLYNILANAIKFSPDGGTIGINIDECGGDNLCKIEIVDQGPGVLEEELDKIFNIYYEGEHKAMVKSSGIGLALAKELVVLHKGSILAENNPAGGLKITVELERFLEIPTLENIIVFKPSYPDLENIDTKVALSVEIEQTAETNNLLTVLIVEDNHELRTFLADKFSDNYKVETAENGEKGLQKALECYPDLILSDVMMPKMDGMEMLTKLKTNSLTSHIPVILLTAKNSTESHIMGLKFGADYYLPKPFDMKLLSVAMNSILTQRKRFFKSMVNAEEFPNDEAVVDSTLITKEDKEFLEKTISVVKERLEDKDFNIDTVADLMNMSRSAFFKKFKSLTNLAPVEFVRDTRLEIGKTMLDAGSKNISEIAYSIGFNNPKYFSTCFKAKYGLSPTEYLSKKDN
nr:two-component regulator propeller domain-containing protein [uncultured Pedobacter sp.]